MSTVAQTAVSSPSPTPSPGVMVGTLRDWLQARLANSGPLDLQDALGILIPLCVEIAEVHAQGYGAFVYPSNLAESPRAGGFSLVSHLASAFPSLPADVACMPPEATPQRLNDARANVYALGAVLYELVTGKSVGPTMQRPRAINPALPLALETILSKALIADPAHRPEDLYALAQALHHLAPKGSIPAPPPAEELDLSVDVSVSMMPPAPEASAAQVIRIVNKPVLPADLAQPAPSPASAALPTKDATAQLAELKARLESDPRPRYVVIKGGMDHGPFSAVELLQQIGSHQFESADELRDEIDGVQKPIEAWEAFAPFASHAQRHRDIQHEKAAIARVAQAETKSVRSKAVVGSLLLGLLLIGGVIAFTQYSGNRRDHVTIQADTVTNIEAEGSLKADEAAKRRYAAKAGSGGKAVAGGQSCEGAITAYKGDEVTIGEGRKGPADLTAGHYGAILNGGSYLNACGVPSSMEVKICAAVQNGRAVGVTVTTTPSDGGRASCIARHIRGITFPSRPNLDVTRTTFAGR